MPKNEVLSIAWIEVTGLPPVRKLEDLAQYIEEPQEGMSMEESAVEQLIEAKRQLGSLAAVKQQRPELLERWERERATRAISHRAAEQKRTQVRSTASMELTKLTREKMAEEGWKGDRYREAARIVCEENPGLDNRYRTGMEKP